MIDDAAADEYAKWFQCLADPTRIKVLHTIAIASAPMTVGEIVEIVGRSQSTVSRHLQVLADGQYIFCEPDGVRTMVRVNTSCMSALPAAAAEIMASGAPSSGGT
ncbi:ArsR/SmtB family transcription factor [Ilumatobacter sp.]|uniref:ArsR/SmtB family transcription factor n=1 Tax=Ilumatobacter sp. TaxID=1967498 RepID=UPI003C36BAB9